MSAGYRMRRSLIWAIRTAAIVAATPVAALTGQGNGKPSPEVAAVLVRSYLEHRLEMIGRAPILRICGGRAKLLTGIDPKKLAADGLIATVDSLCVDDGPPPEIPRLTATIEIHDAVADTDSAYLHAIQVYGSRWYAPETAIFTKGNPWSLRDLTVGTLRVSTGTVIPYTTRSNRPPSIPPDSGR